MNSSGNLFATKSFRMSANARAELERHDAWDRVSAALGCTHPEPLRFEQDASPLPLASDGEGETGGVEPDTAKRAENDTPGTVTTAKGDQAIQTHQQNTVGAERRGNSESQLEVTRREAVEVSPAVSLLSESGFENPPTHSVETEKMDLADTEPSTRVLRQSQTDAGSTDGAQRSQTQGVVTADASKTGSEIAAPDPTSPLLTGLLTGLEITGTPLSGSTRQITYSFAGFGDEFDEVNGTAQRADRAWAPYEQTQIAAALDVIEHYIDVSFVETQNNISADMTFFAAQVNGILSRGVFQEVGELGFAFLPSGGSRDGNIVLNVDGFGWDPGPGFGNTYDGGLEQFGFGFQTILHEVGHALGLDHPFESGALSTLFPGLTDADNDGVADDPFTDSGSFELNQSAYTVMSYVNGWTGHPFGTANTFLIDQFVGLPGRPGGHIGTPMAIDIGALQTVYGANQNAAAGDTVYVLPDTQAQTTGYQAIWDTSGTDRIEYTGNRNVVIDLRPATLAVEDGGGGFVSYVNEALLNDPVVGGFTIAHGAEIEGAVSGGGSDTLTGNELSNTLDAGAGIDLLIGGAGDDTMTGGAGADTFFIADGSGDDVITDFSIGQDIIDVEALFIAFERLIISDAAGGTRIDYNNGVSVGSLLLQGVTASSLSSTDFVVNPDAPGTLYNGSAGDDDLTGSNLDEQFFGFAGNDTLIGLGGQDLLDGGEGNDQLDGGAGNDTLVPGTGNDTVTGGEGTGDADMLVYADLSGPITVTYSGDETGSVSGNSNDTFEEIEILSLTNQGDTVDASATSGGVTVHAAAGDDSVTGGTGNDSLVGGAGADSIDGGLGIDIVDYGSSDAGVTITLDGSAGSGGHASGDLITGVEVVIGSDHDDFVVGNVAANTLTGSTGSDNLFGEAGNDSLSGGADNDSLYGGTGNDTLSGGTGNDRYFVDSAGDVVSEGADEGIDLVTTAVSFVLPDEVEQGSMQGTDDIDLTGNALSNFITANAGANTLSGMGGADRLIAGEGDDTLIGGAGNDILEGQGGADRFVLESGGGDDQVRGWETGLDLLDFTGIGLRFTDLRISESGADALIAYDIDGASLSSVRLTGVDPTTLTSAIMLDPTAGGAPYVEGGIGDDADLGGTNGNDEIVALAGDDTINGRAGDDMMLGGFGNDRYFLFETGDQAIELEFQGTDQMDATFSFTLSAFIENGNALGTGDIDITGNELANFLTGNAGANVLTGGDGRDRLIARDGEDRLIGGLENDVLEGGADADLFVFETDSAIDLITDFEVGVDLLDVTALGISFAEMTIVDGPLGALVIFDLAPGSVDLVTLQGVSATDVRLASFITVFGDNQPPITGTSGDDLIFGTVEDDELQGLAGNDFLDGKEGADRMLGGLGDDRYVLDQAGDQVVELPGEGTDQMDAAFNFTLTAEVENGTALGTDSVDISGNALANRLSGNDGSNRLEGGAGADNLLGFGGADDIVGGIGNDFLRGGTGADIFRFATGDGADQILDFELGLDTIDLSATGLTFGALTIADSGANAVVTYGADQITVFNTTAAALDEAQFDLTP